MVDYNLAKKLKDAGFPFHHPESKWSKYIFPTLSELIEACGERFGYLWQELDIKEWCACGQNWSIFTQGKDPYVAVAKLWLKLNKKQKNYGSKKK